MYIEISYRSFTDSADDYHQTSNIRRTKSQNVNVPRLVLQLPLPRQLRPGLSWSLRCSWSRSWSYYICVINNLMAHQREFYIRSLRVLPLTIFLWFPHLRPKIYCFDFVRSISLYHHLVYSPPSPVTCNIHRWMTWRPLYISCGFRPFADH